MKPINRKLGTCYYPEHWPDGVRRRCTENEEFWFN